MEMNVIKDLAALRVTLILNPNAGLLDRLSFIAVYPS
jgi:hypothetical protein